MPDFSTKSREISATLDRLVTELTNVETKVESTSNKFSRLADQASRVEELETSVTGLKTVLDKLDVPFLDRLARSAESLNSVLDSINPRGLQQINIAYERQINQLQEILSLQRQIQQTQQPNRVGNTALLERLITSPTPQQAPRQQVQNVQGFDRHEFLTNTSKIYGQFNYVSSQFGSLLNSLQLSSRGLETIKSGHTIGGGLDIAAGTLKGIQALATISDTLRKNVGIGFLPQGAGSAFNKRRSDTVLDLVEILVGLTTGQRRAPEPRGGDKASGVSTGKAYRYGSTGKKGISGVQPSDIEGDVDGFSSPAMQQYVREEIKTYLTETEKQISDAANDAVKDYLHGTKGSKYSNLLVNSQQTAANIVGQQQAYPGFGGYNAYLNGVAFQSLATDPLSQARHAGGQGFVALHELSHAAVNDTDLNQTAIAASTERRAKELTMQVRDSILADAKGTQFKGIADRLLSQKDYSVAKPEEAYANVGATLLANQGELTQLVTKIYGEDLFNSIKRNLQQYQPEVFGEEVVKKIGDQYHVLNQQLNQAISGAIEPPTAAVQQEENQLKTFVDSIFNNLADSLSPDLLQTLRQHADTTVETIRSVLLQVINAVSPEATTGIAAGAQGIQGVQGFTLPTAQSLKGFVGKLNYGALQQNLIDQLVGETLAPILQGAIRNIDINQVRAQLQGAGGGVNIASLQKQVQQVFNASLDAVLQRSFSALVVDPTRPSFGKFLSEVVPGGAQSRVARSLINQVIDPNSAAARLGAQRPLQNFLAYQVGQQLRPQQETDYFTDINNKFLAKAGEGLQRGSYNQQLTYDFNEGITRVAVSAKTASGAMVQLNGRVNEFNDLVLETAKENPLSKFMNQFLIQIPRQFADQFIYGMVSGIQELLKTVIQVQGELTEVQTIFEKLGSTQAKRATSDFLYSSIDTANQTGQPLIIQVA